MCGDLIFAGKDVVSDVNIAGYSAYRKCVPWAWFILPALEWFGNC